MKVAPTLDGRLRIDLESEIDVVVLRPIVSDASSSNADLASRLGHLMEGDLEDDWSDFVVPGLRESFNEQLSLIAKSLMNVEPDQPVFIMKSDADSWYGGLNQARLALEERFHFEDRDFEEIPPEERSARLRSRFYQVVQGLLLEFLMT